MRGLRNIQGNVRISYYQSSKVHILELLSFMEEDMLSLDELLKIKHTPNEDDISLKLYAELYQKYISNRIYELHLDNGMQLVFWARDCHLPHLLALHKFKDGRKGNKHPNYLLNSAKNLKGQNGFDNLINGKIKIDDLRLVNGNAKLYRNYKKRILNFPFTYQLLRKSIFISYNKSLVDAGTDIKGDFMFVNDIDDSKLHFFFINGTNRDEGKTVPITFIREKSTDYTYVEKQDQLKINKIKITDMMTESILEEYSFEKCDESVIKSDSPIVPKEIEKDGQHIST